MPSKQEKFERPEIIRPPSEWRSYYLPLTSGCSNNACAFCSYYGSKLKVRKVDQIKQEIDAVALYMKHGVTLPSIPGIVYEIAQYWDQRRVFLQDGDALVIPINTWWKYWNILMKNFPIWKELAPMLLHRTSCAEARMSSSG